MRVVAQLVGVSFSDVKLVVDQAVSFVAKVMKRGRFEGIRLPGLGTFWAKAARVRNVEERKLKAKSNESVSGGES